MEPLTFKAGHHHHTTDHIQSIKKKRLFLKITLYYTSHGTPEENTCRIITRLLFVFRNELLMLIEFPKKVISIIALEIPTLEFNYNVSYL